MIPSTTLIVLMLVATLLPVACNYQPAGSPPDAAPSPQTQPPIRSIPKINVSALGKRLHRIINKQRRNHGIPTLHWDDALTRIAEKHSRDMASRNYFSHTSPDGFGYSQRYLKNNYACGITVDNVTHTGGENIFQYALSPVDNAPTGQQTSKPLTGDDIGNAVIQNWLSSPEDRSNIVSPHWRREGVGIFIGPDNIIYITVNYC